jgi:glycosyltransferase involved in cell wall biosynthesis
MGHKMNKKVLRIITRLNVGGPTKHVAWLSSGLARAGWTGLLVCGTVEADEDDMGSFVSEFSLEVQNLNSIKRSIDIRNDAKAIREIYRLLCDYQPTIVHTHMSKAGLVGRTAVMFYNLLHREKIKTVHTFHGHTFHGYFSPAKERLFLWIEQFLAKYATSAIVTISSQQQAEIRDVYKVGKACQHHQINLGIDTGFAKELDRDSLRQELGIAKNCKVFGIVGRIADIKNHHLFVDSVRDFVARHPACDTCFVIIGDGEKSYVDALKHYARDVPQVIFAGNRTDPRQFYGALDYLALTSKNEGTPVSILESFACGIPVVSTGVGGVVDLIGKNERGYIVEPTAMSISNGFWHLLNTDHTTSTKLAKEFVELNYSINGLVKKIDGLYSELLGVAK